MLEQLERTIRIVTADDHPIARRGVRELLSDDSDISVVDEADDADGARRCIEVQQPDVAVLDLFMPGRPVLELIPDLRRDFAATAIVILTMQREPAYARRALAAGASGYVLKDRADEDLVAAIRCAVRGESYVTPRLAARLATAEAAFSPGGLSARELEILRLLALGHTNSQISDKLFLSVRTVESHRAHIQQKLDVQDRHGIVEFAFAHGLIAAHAG